MRIFHTLLIFPWILFADIVDDISSNNNGMVAASAYKYSNDTISFSSGVTRRDYLSVDHKSRVRQSGDVLGITVGTGSGIMNSHVTELYVTFWREVGVNSFDLVQCSENVRQKLSNNGNVADNTVIFDTPVSGVLEGDYIGYSIISTKKIPNVLRRKDSVNAIGTYFVNESIPSSTGYNWLDQISNSNYVPIVAIMNPPNMVAIGNSLTAGHNLHWSFVENQQIDDVESTILWKICDHFGWSCQNMGIGGGVGQSGSQLNRFQSDVVDLLPKAVMIHAGNGINQGHTIEEFIDNVEAMLDMCLSNNITAIVHAPYCRTDWSDLYSQHRRDANDELEILVSNYPGFIYINFDTVIGQIRPSTGEYDDLIPAYTSDGTHLTEAGNQAVANKIIDVLNGE